MRQSIERERIFLMASNNCSNPVPSEVSRIWGSQGTKAIKPGKDAHGHISVKLSAAVIQHLVRNKVWSLFSWTCAVFAIQPLISNAAYRETEHKWAKENKESLVLLRDWGKRPSFPGLSSSKFEWCYSSHHCYGKAGSILESQKLGQEI